jgi:hypothetical protein
MAFVDDFSWTAKPVISIVVISIVYFFSNLL